MRIAMITDYYLPTLGGVQTVIKAHHEELERAGHEVTVCTPLAADSEDPAIVRLPTARGFAPDGYPFTWPPSAATAVLREQLRDRGVEVVHVHTEMFAALAGFRAARALGIPVVQTMHGRIDVYTRSVLPLPAVTTAVLAWMHRRLLPHERIRSSSAPYARTHTARRMWRLMVSQANHADQVVVPSAHFAAKLAEQGVRTPVTVLSNGLEDTVLERIGTPEPRTAAAGEELSVLWCGRVSPEKRPEVFVDAIAGLDGIRADLIGDGVARESLARRAARLPAGRLSVHGAVPQSEVLDAMRRAHVLVSSSYDFDNQPMVILEAVASGLPVIVTDPDLAETFPDGAGMVTRTPDAAGLAAALQTLRDRPELIERMSRAALARRETVAQSTHRDALLGVYRAAIAGAPHASVRRRSPRARAGRRSR